MIARKRRIGRLLIAALACGAAILLAEDKPKTSPAEDNNSTAVSTRHFPHIRLGTISVGASYSRYSGFPYGYPYSPFYYTSALPYWLSLYDFYGPLYYPAYHPGFYSGFARGPNLGEVRLRTESKQAEVFLDGAYAGRSEDLKSMWLEPGAYNLEVKAPDRPPFSKRIYVLTGKTLRLEATPEARP